MPVSNYVLPPTDPVWDTDALATNLVSELISRVYNGEMHGHLQNEITGLVLYFLDGPDCDSDYIERLIEEYDL